MKIIDKIKGVFQKMGAETKIAKEFKDIFEIGGVPSFNQYYYFGIFIWKYLYKGFYQPWHLVRRQSIEPLRDFKGNIQNNRELFRTNIAKALCAEMAGLIWSEECQVNVNLKDFEPTEDENTDKAGRFIEYVLKKNNFSQKMQEAIEQMLALGGEAIKVWYEVQHDENGNEIPNSGIIKIGWCMADQFIPIAWDNAKVDSCVFISRKAINGYYYTRLEWHKWNGATYTISNELYRAEMRNGANENQDILGFRYPLNAIYPFLDEQTEIHNLEQSLFTYMRTPTANNLDDNSPLGMSIYGNALSTLKAIDETYDSLVREIELGRKRIIVPAKAVKKIASDDTGEPVRYFDATDEVYQALATDDTDSLKIVDNSVEMRIAPHIEALNAHLSKLCLDVGFSSGTFTFDMKNGIKTATEVVSENSKTYKTVKCCQNMIAPAIKGLIHNIFALACLYDVEFEGEKVNSWFNESEPLQNQYELNIYWDDSIIQDRQTNINEGINFVNNGLISKITFLTKYLGLTVEQAKEELLKVSEEKSINANNVDMFFNQEEE